MQCQYKTLNLLDLFYQDIVVTCYRLKAQLPGCTIDCPHFLSPWYKPDRCFDRFPIHFKDTLMYVDPITRQTYDYATPIACDSNPRIIELVPDSDNQDFYILGQGPIKRKPPLRFTPSQIKCTLRPNSFKTQVVGMYSNAELDQFWNRINFIFRTFWFYTSTFRKSS